MKIALVSPYDWLTPGGVNSHIDSLADRLFDRGHSVRILAPTSGEVDDPRVVPAGRVVPIPVSGSVARISLNPRLGHKVKQLLADEQFDVVHVHEPLMPSLPIQVLRHSRLVSPGVVNVGTFHATKDGGNRLYSYGRRLLKRWYREIDGKITVSPPSARYVSRYFPGYYNVIPNGVDIDRFADPAIEPLEQFRDGSINILYVGRAEKRKGLAYLLRAFGMVSARNPETRLIVVGPDSRERRRYKSMVKQSGMRNIVFADDVSDAELPRYHRSADILCSPATGNESQGYVLLEAMSASLPVVASNIDGYASVITHEAEGLLARPKDPMALADALTSLVRNADQRAAMAAAGRRKVDEYSWPRVTQRIVSYYERLIDDHASHERLLRGRVRPWARRR
ncbi:MAG TPA: glycosyltransferase family 4 protein [Dehalococcoidia bacterium]|jgi:phosphatidylinositol alpha-mannosyltransferase|nr:glycosyltransferase family 4 protein [Dehalococcoidia bacterium]